MSKTSLSSSRRSSKMRDDSELYLECKAAFLTEFDDIEEKIESKNKLVSLLQLTGRNPTRLALNKYWSTGTRTLSFSDFVEICNKEPITKEDDLMKAFRKIDINGDGYISLDELYKIMNQKGESMSRDEVRKMIDEVDENKDGRLDYKEFTQMVLQTAEKSKQMSKKVMERKERKKKKGELSEAPKRRESTSSQHSQVSKQDDIVPQSPKQGQTKHDKTTLGSPTESIKAAMSSKSEPKSNLYPNLNVDADKAAANKNINEKITSEKSPKSSSVVLQDQVSKGSPRKDAQTSAKSSPKHVEFEPIRTPRGKFGIPTITQLERPGTSYRKELDENHATKSTNDFEDISPFKINIPQDSARSVQEEIPLEDDDDIVSTGRSTPRVHLSSRKDTPKSESARSVKHDPDQDGQKKEEKDDNELGSQSSLRSDDLPRPSPRVRTSKTKSPSSSLRSKDKLPDARSLQDWYHYTSKGCFFYEDEEIVGHVYNLRLQDDSLVYLSAEPISEPPCLNLPGSEPIDTALYVFDSSGRLVTTTEQRDVQGTYGVKVELSAGEYQILPYTTGCRFKQRQDMSASQNEAKLVKKNKDDKIHITSVFREALKNIFNLCDLDGNGTMSKDEFNWFNVRTSGEELGDEEWEVVEEKTTLRDGEITLEGFIELNELEAEDAEGDVEDLWITLTSMGMNKALIMDEACPYRVNVYVKDVGRKKPSLRVTGIESLEKREFVTEICQSVIEKSPGPISIRKMKDLFLYTYKNDYRATMVIENKSRSTVMLQIDCSKSRNVISNRSGLDHTFEIDPQQTAIAHHLMPKSELSDWTVESTQSIQK